MNTPPLTQIIVGDAQKAVSKSLGLSDKVEFYQIMVEAIRKAIWGHWRSESRPVYITRILNTAKQTLQPWQGTMETKEPPIHDQLRLTLEEMEQIGDMVALPGGYWAPAPLRKIELTAINAYLIIGGMPSVALPPALCALLKRQRCARIVGNDSDALDGIDIPTQAEHEWLRKPLGGLDSWTENILKKTIRNSMGDITLEIYDAAKDEIQYYRWVKPSAKTNGRYLARMQAFRGTTRYYIAEYQRGKLVSAGIPDLVDGDVRRLMYGLDLRAKNPVSITVHSDASQYTFELSNEIPLAEYRQMLTLGMLQNTNDGAYYPRVWVVKKELNGQAIKVFQNLGVKITS